MQPTAVTLVSPGSQTVGPDVVIDSRRVTAGSLFVAVPGERVDGHDFAGVAVTAGAAAVLGTRATPASVPHLLVDDTVAGLSSLARGIVSQARSQGLISIGITGSSGKTSTKDLLAQILEAVAPTVAPEGSQNNEIGVPLTACRVEAATKFLVSEMGARGMGHISWLTSLVGLDIGVVLNVGAAHVGEFGGLAATATAKAEIVADLPPRGWAVLNADDPAVAGMAERTQARIAWCGEGELPEGELRVQAREVRLNQLSQPSFELVVTSGDQIQRARVSLTLIGRHQVSNALAAATAAIAAGVGLDTVAQALAAAVPRSGWRMELRTRADGVMILNDSYNANPDSMAAALRTAVDLGTHQRSEFADARVIAILGDMLELGPESAQFHTELGRLAGDFAVSEVIAVGESAQLVRDCARDAGLTARVASRDDVAGSLNLHPGDVVLIKGSRGIGLEAVAAALLELPEATQ
ncbi:MAG: UDP-N-acetylmuramoyl-tripeptide--D-alanyl-D-alanine ligase [Arachnia sp.]